jgi:predicted deacetylase
MCERLLSLIASYGENIPLTLLVVPQWHRQAPIDRSGAWRGLIDRLLSHGSEIALHGLWHVDDGGRSPSFRAALARRALSAREAEFAALSAAEARLRIETGMTLLRRCGWRANGFVPPAWQISEQAAAVIGEFPFEYTTSWGSMTSLPGAQCWSVPCLGLSARSALRRSLSSRWIAWRWAQLAEVPAVRLALHPLDACYDTTLQLCQQLLRAVLEDRQPLTKSGLCRALAAGGGGRRRAR